MYLPRGRRRLIAGSVALAMLAAGCSADNEDSPTDPSEDGAFQITESLPPASGPVESVTWTVSSEPDQLDPARRARNIPSETVRAAICESLWRITPDRKLEPALAVSVDSPDPTTFVYQLREGVRFNDGTEMTADDVVASLSRHLDPEVGSVVADAFKNVESIEATGPLEVTVTLSEPDHLFNQQMAGEAGRVESAAFLDEAGADYGSPDFGLNCTGPFKFEHWEVGNSITLVRNDDYWDDDNPPLAEKFTFIFPTDGSARINALVAGEIDGGYNVPEGASRTLLAADSGNLYFGPGTQAYSMIANQSGVLGDVRVRRAISLALDRQGTITAGFDGFGSVARVPIGQYAWAALGLDRAEEIYQSLPDTAVRDVEQARELIAEAGVEGSEIVIAYTPQVPQMVALANATYAAVEEIGLVPVMLEMERPDFSRLTASPTAKDEAGVDLWPIALRQPLADPLETFSIWHTDSVYNHGDYSNPGYDALVEQALAEPDDQARAELTVEMAEIIAEDLPWIPISVTAYTLFLNNRLAGAPATIEGLGPWAGRIGTA